MNNTGDHTEGGKIVSINAARNRKQRTHETYIFSVSYGTGCYRHIRISSGERLDALHELIIEAFGFIDDHAHAFFMDNRRWSDADSYYVEFIEDADRYTCNYVLSDVGMRIGAPFKYIFDFGEEWVFQLKLLRILEEKTDTPQIIRSVGDAPSQYPDYDDEYDDDENDDEGLAMEYPEVYPPEKLNALYGELPLPPETVKLLLQYFDAFGNLHGIMPLRKALEIYNQQNPPIDEQAFAQFADIARHEDRFFCVLEESDLYIDGEASGDPMNREIIDSSLIDFDDDYEEMQTSQARKPFYIPQKNELLQYSENSFCEVNASYIAMRELLIAKMNLSYDDAEDVTSDLQLMAYMAETSIEHIFSEMERMRVTIQSEEDVRLFIDQYFDIVYNTRTPVNRGYTSNELLAMCGMPLEMRPGIAFFSALRRGDLKINEVLEKARKLSFHNDEMHDLYFSLLDILKNVAPVGGKTSAPATPKVKIGRNDPCPCGSEKKYKNCCGN